MTQTSKLEIQMSSLLENQKRLVEINEVVGHMIVDIRRMMFALIVLVIIGLFLI